MKIAISILSVLLAANIAFSIYTYTNKQEKSGYVYIEKLYEGYKGKTDIEKDLKVVENKQKNLLDTLRLEIIDLENKIQGGNSSLANAVEIKRGNYNRLVQEFSEYNSAESQKHVQNLLKQINAHVKDYGERNGFKYIFGATGDGSLMYASDTEDLTKDVLDYINKKYEGE